MPNPNYQNNNGKIKIKINDSWIEPQFERYENLEPIGEPGANGVVIKGTHKITKREDAIKIWLPRNRNGKEQVNEKQYLKEIQKITKLNDPRIVKIYDAWKENSCYCCSMEFIAGITYEAWLKKNCDITVRINMLLKIFDAIVFYQSQGIIHGDIHLKNILIDENEEIHIIDFGTSIISSYEEQSIYRENFLMYELLEKTLGVKFDKKAFWYNKYKLQGNIEQSDDIRKAIPILFSRSVRSYLKLMIMLTNTHNIINDSEKIYEYCGYLAKDDIEFETICLVEQLYQNLICKKPVKQREIITSIISDMNVKEGVNLDDLIGKQIFFQYNATTTFELFEKEFSLPAILGIFNSTFKSYEILDDNKTKIILGIKDKNQKPFTAILCFASDSDLNEYVKENPDCYENILSNAKFPQDYLE